MTPPRTRAWLENRRPLLGGEALAVPHRSVDPHRSGEALIVVVPPSYSPRVAFQTPAGLVVPNLRFGTTGPI